MDKGMLENHITVEKLVLIQPQGAYLAPLVEWNSKEYSGTFKT